MLTHNKKISVIESFPSEGLSYDSNKKNTTHFLMSL